MRHASARDRVYRIVDLYSARLTRTDVLTFSSAVTLTGKTNQDQVVELKRRSRRALRVTMVQIDGGLGK